ncbi:hypothetical protein L204_100467 [Cryptococcus depauperatus]
MAAAPISPDRVEAPVTVKAYLLCVFASFGGIFFGFDSGYMNGVLGMNYFINMMTGLPIPPHNADKATKDAFTLRSWEKSLITSILSAGTFFGAIIAGDLADYFGRRITIISGCGIFIVGCILQTASSGLGLVSGDIILGGGLFCLPESPRWYVKHGKIEDARAALARVRGQPVESDYIKDEIDEIVANHEYETELIPSETYFSSWAACFSGGFRNPQSNLRRTVLGITLQMMQQWTGVNFIFYFGTTFFTDLGTISNPFFISLITTLVNVCSTPISFWTIERFGRRPLLIYGALGMFICEFIVGIIGVAKPHDSQVVKAQISFICIYIFFFASTWGPGAWVCIGEIFPIPIRSRGVGLSTASNWFWNCIIAVITPYMVGTDKGNLGSRVFFIWGSTCVLCFLYAYFFVWETKSLTLEQVDRMMEECGSPRRSSGWKPHSTFAAEMHHQHEKMDVTQKEKIGEEEGLPATHAANEMQV